MSLREDILKLKKEKNAVILGHYYQRAEIQDISDFIGDSLALAKQAQTTNADIIVFCGVHFMAETAKILNPNKKVLLPDPSAGCSLADSCQAEDLRAFKALHPDALVMSYINCSAEVKTLSDVICTSGNALQLVDALPKDQKIIFAPDKNLGAYINRMTGRQMILWDGYCHVHDQMRCEAFIQLKEKHPKTPLLAHPECTEPLLLMADFVGSTAAMLNYVSKSNSPDFIIATESGIIHQMQKSEPHKQFYLPDDSENCHCNDCSYMKLNTLEKLYACLRDESPEIILPEKIIQEAQKSLLRMLK